MEDFRFYSPEDVIYVNLRETAARMGMVWEQELAHLRELAEQITSDIINNPYIGAALRDLTPADSGYLSEAPKKGDPLFQQWSETRKTAQTVILCMEIKKKLATTTSVDADLFFNDQEETPLRTVNRIAYQKSSYADAAYLRFAEVMPLPRAVNTHSFQSACEDVYNGLCEFCILPLENTSEGQLHTFSRLIDRYGLKIAATCDITAGDGTRTTKFALLQKLLIPLDRVKFKSAPCFEFSYPMSSDPAPAALLQAAKMCGLRLLRVETRPQIEKDMPALGHYVFDTEGGDLFSYLLFLSMTAPEHEIIGVYPHL